MQKRSVDYIYAGFWPRAAAYLIDRFIVALVCFAMKFSTLISEVASGSGSYEVLFGFTMVDIMCYAAGALYFTLATYKNGHTVGKFLMRLTVITEDGTQLSFFRALYRETVGRFLTGICCIGYIVAASDEQKRGFHDRLSDTRVVYAFGKYEKYLSLPGDPRLEKAKKEESSDDLQVEPIAVSAAVESPAVSDAPTLPTESGDGNLTEG